MGRPGPGGNSGSLTHYGVKGMKWGVTRSDPPASSAPAPQRPKLPPSDDVKAAANSQLKIMEGGTHSLSNQELQGLLTRMNLERQYRTMTTAPPGSPQKSALDQGHAHVKKALAIGETIEKVNKFAKSDTGKAIKKGVGVAISAGLAYATGGTSAAAAAGAGAIVKKVME
jgi:hypothetical protein